VRTTARGHGQQRHEEERRERERAERRSTAEELVAIMAWVLSARRRACLARGRRGGARGVERDALRVRGRREREGQRIRPGREVPGHDLRALRRDLPQRRDCLRGTGCSPSSIQSSQSTSACGVVRAGRGLTAALPRYVARWMAVVWAVGAPAEEVGERQVDP
jgi:hypothetical protein